MSIEYVLYGLPKGETERYTEVLLIARPNTKQFETVKEMAAKDGYHSFRIAEIDLSIAPDFGKTVR